MIYIYIQNRTELLFYILSLGGNAWHSRRSINSFPYCLETNGIKYLGMSQSSLNLYSISMWSTIKRNCWYSSIIMIKKLMLYSWIAKENKWLVLSQCFSLIFCCCFCCCCCCCYCFFFCCTPDFHRWCNLTDFIFLFSFDYYYFLGNR